MSRKLTRDELVLKAQSKFGFYMSYSLVSENASKNDEIYLICPVHGKIKTTFAKHLDANNPCSLCYKESLPSNYENYIKIVHKLYNDYVYDKIDLTHRNILVKCKKHSYFKVDKYEHLKGRKCPKCEKGEKQDKLVNKIRNLYSTFDISVEDSKVYFVCKCGNKITTSVETSLKGSVECSECKKDKFIENLKVKYPDYDFKRINDVKMKVTCKIHGSFEKNIKSSMINGPCLQCNPVNSTYKHNFIERANKIHNNKYIYESTPTFCHDVVKIRCKKHGIFVQDANSHINGHGCPVCSSEKKPSFTSKAETEILKLIPDAVQSNKSVIYPLELDIYSEKYNFAVEYDGILWHSEGTTFPVNKNLKNRHKRKTDMCKSKGIQLFHIFDNEFTDKTKKQIWYSIIFDKMGKNTKIDSDSCYIEELSIDKSNEFLSKNHLEGYTDSDIRAGLYYEDKIIQIMTFKQINNVFEIKRECTSINLKIKNGYKKILNYFEQKYKPHVIKYKANRRYCDIDRIKELGFNFKYMSEPKYFYFKDFKFLPQNIKMCSVIDDYDINLSETENAFHHKYRKIFDAGYIICEKVYK